ncbi:uncharacterized protein LOC131667276 isoform X2 [Phymastichus coffea]|nr:uncharacterized protein LOC131667276 isoform X2 [Phymastichus coffea]
MQSEYCPLCSKNGAKVRVRAYQLNLEEAVFMCSTKECTWPVGYHELLFMDRLLGKHSTNNWPEVADKFLAEHFKKQCDSLSELSAYTPPQTPGNSKDTIHDATTGTVGPSSLSMVKEIDTLEQQPSTSKSISSFEIPVIDLSSNNIFDGKNTPFDIPIIDCTHYNTSIFDDKTVSLESMSGLKSDLLNTKNDNVMETFSRNDISLGDTFAKVSAVNKSIVIKNEKPSFVPERSVISDNVQHKKFRIIGKQKSKSFNYKKQFDIFDDIKKAKSTNEQCKAKITIKKQIDLDKMKPNEIRDILFVNSKSKTNNLGSACKLESTENSVIKLEPIKQVIKMDKTVYKSDVNSQIEVEKNKSDTSSQIETSNEDYNVKVENVALELLKKESSDNLYAQYDISTMIDTSTELESERMWSRDHHNLDSLLEMLEDRTAEDNLMTTDNISSATTSLTNDTLKNKKIDNDVSNDLNIEVDSIIDNLMTTDNTLSATASISNDTLQSEQLENKTIANDVSNDLKIEVDSIIDDDTLQCTIEDTDDSFFTSLFSPPMKQ